MTDLFRGYDLTTVADKVAESEFERAKKEGVLRYEGVGWASLPATTKHAFKSNLLPIITAVLDALESEEVKPTEAKAMREYAYRADDPTRYENVDPMHNMETCTVWVLHMNIHPDAKDAVLERASVLPETTGEYTYGDSWTEWGESTTDDTDRHLAIYFHATPVQAAGIGYHLANHATLAAIRALGGDSGNIPPYAVSTSGDYAEQLPNL